MNVGQPYGSCSGGPNWRTTVRLPLSSPRDNVLNAMNPHRFTAKVFSDLEFLRTTKGNHRETMQLLLTAMQYMWIYDYLLTVRDEVLYLRRFNRGTNLTISQINYAWSGRRSWGKLISSALQCQQLMQLADSIRVVHCGTAFQDV